MPPVARRRTVAKTTTAVEKMISVHVEGLTAAVTGSGGTGFEERDATVYSQAGPVISVGDEGAKGWGGLAFEPELRPYNPKRDAERFSACVTGW